MSDRRPVTIEYHEDDGRYTVALDGVALAYVHDEAPVRFTEEELRWLGVVLIPAALPPLPVPGLDKPTKEDDGT